MNQQLTCWFGSSYELEAENQGRAFGNPSGPGKHKVELGPNCQREEKCRAWAPGSFLVLPFSRLIILKLWRQEAQRPSESSWKVQWHFQVSRVLEDKNSHLGSTKTETVTKPQAVRGICGCWEVPEGAGTLQRTHPAWDRFGCWLMGITRLTSSCLGEVCVNLLWKKGISVRISTIFYP